MCEYEEKTITNTRTRVNAVGNNNTDTHKTLI